jgi:hypothetical protein
MTIKMRQATPEFGLGAMIKLNHKISPLLTLVVACYYEAHEIIFRSFYTPCMN